MAKFIYLPVPSQEMLGLASAWNNGRLEKEKTPYTILQSPVLSGFGKGIRRRFGFLQLSRLICSDTLYILIHGAPRGSRFLGADRG